MRRIGLLAAVWLECLLCLPARADDPVLHEYVPHIDADEVSEALAPSATARQSEARDAGAATATSESTPRPAAASENFRPDRQTSLEGGLDYYETFNPSIAPFQRVMALDATHLDRDGITPVLGTHSTRRKPVPIETRDAPAPDPRPRDRFVGELDVDFRGERSQRLPSVSPESRILDLRVTPEVDVVVERDGADNYYLRVQGEPPSTPVHVRFETDAPRAYFGAAIPRVPLRRLPDEVPPLQPSIARRALRFAAELGITEQSDLRSALEALTQHFRAFVESQEPPENSGDLFLDLSRGKKGLCRHRAYGFVVTAQALGIPARFVQNEAHSFVEVKLPGSGFLRIDLGGAAHGLTAHNAHERPSYVPAQPDTLPRPDSYRASYAQAEMPASKTTAQALAEPEELAGRWLPEASPKRAAGRERAPIKVEQTPLASESSADKLPLHISLNDQRLNALRGGTLVLTGRVLDTPRHGVGDLRVEVWIAQNKRRERMLLGVSVTDADGYFRAAFGVPPDLAVGDYRLIVVSTGDELHMPVVAE